MIMACDGLAALQAGLGIMAMLFGMAAVYWAVTR